MTLANALIYQKNWPNESVCNITVCKPGHGSMCIRMYGYSARQSMMSWVEHWVSKNWRWGCRNRAWREQASVQTSVHDVCTDSKIYQQLLVLPVITKQEVTSTIRVPQSFLVLLSWVRCFWEKKERAGDQQCAWVCVVTSTKLHFRHALHIHLGS